MKHDDDHVHDKIIVQEDLAIIVVLLGVRLVHKRDGCDHSCQQVESESEYEHQNENPKGPFAHTVVQQSAMVIETLYAVVASTAVVRLREAFNLAGDTVTIAVVARV